jgi:quercetin dioxygenase-like cupin family protein
MKRGVTGFRPANQNPIVANLKLQVTVILLALFGFCAIAGGDELAPARHADEQEGAATIIHRADVVHDSPAAGGAPMRLWPLYSTPEARMNYVEVTGRSGLHFHPDADHRLYVLEGKVTVIAGTNTTTAGVGDLIIIPKGVRHAYDVPAKGGRALLLTFDAPPYDPHKTVNLGSPGPLK